MLPADTYRLLSGSRQVWRLFHTIPFLRSLRAHVQTVDADGTKHTGGFILPGFVADSPGDDSRFNTLLERFLAHPLGEPYRKAYIQKINRLKNAGRPPEENRQWALVFEGEAIRNLFYSRIDRRVALPFEREFAMEKPPEQPR